MHLHGRDFTGRVDARSARRGEVGAAKGNRTHARTMVCLRASVNRCRRWRGRSQKTVHIRYQFGTLFIF